MLTEPMNDNTRSNLDDMPNTQTPAIPEMFPGFLDFNHAFDARNPFNALNNFNALYENNGLPGQQGQLDNNNNNLVQNVQLNQANNNVNNNNNNNQNNGHHPRLQELAPPTQLPSLEDLTTPLEETSHQPMNLNDNNILMNPMLQQAIEQAFSGNVNNIDMPGLNDAENTMNDDVQKAAEKQGFQQTYGLQKESNPKPNILQVVV